MITSYEVKALDQETKTFLLSEELGVELYRFTGVKRAFPNHFHEYYSIGLLERGRRLLSCRNRDYELEPGDILLLNPEDNHTCRSLGTEPMDYCGLNFSKESMARWTREATGALEPPIFTRTVLRDRELAVGLGGVQQVLYGGESILEAEEQLLLFLENLLERYSCSQRVLVFSRGEEVDRVCSFLETHYAEPICLEQLCRCTGLSKSTLLRIFTKERGITPYRYLQTVRVNRAKELLEQGVPPLEAALVTGFSDQSHFTNSFRSMIGTTPGAYQGMYGQRESGKGEKRYV